jgi:ATP/maltotriose-dependent transcriptional regulator MalT
MLDALTNFDAPPTQHHTEAAGGTLPARRHGRYLAGEGGVVAGRGMIQSPVIVGRDDLLALARRRLAEAAAGAGQLLLLAGEAGIGKTRLLDAVAHDTGPADLTVVRAAAYPDDADSFAGLLLDLASDLGRSPDAGLGPAGRDLSARIHAITAAEGDAQRRRRLLVQDLVDRLLALPAGGPVLMILEDLHWADELSLDVLGHLANRLRATPMLVAGAYRSDELTARRPLRDLRLRLLAQRLAEEIRLPRLGLDQVAALAGAILGRPAPEALVAALHERGDGIPLHVEELLAAVPEDTLTADPATLVREVAVPETVGEAVLGRMRGLAPPTRAVASAAAVIGRSFDFDLLTSVTEIDPGDVGTALRELQEAHLVIAGADAASFDFRHALIRDSLYADTDLPERRRLHDRVARGAAARGHRDAFVSAHFEHAGRVDLAHRHAVAAAGEAASVSAHREALELYRRAVRTVPDGLPPLRRAALYAALGDAAAASDDNAAAAEAYRTAHELTTAAGDHRAAAALVPDLVAVEHLLGDGLEARVSLLQAALDSLDGVIDADRERARLHSAMALAYMLDRRLDEAIGYGERSRADCQRIGDEDATVNADTTLGSVLVFAGRMDEGWRLLETGVVRARHDEREAEAARAYRLIGCTTSVMVEYDRAERWLVEGSQYAERVQLWNHRHYMASHLAHVHWATGDWDAATEMAQRALADGRGGITTRITALYVLGYVAMGRADWTPAAELLGDALRLGEQMAELERWSPPLWGMAESARCRGEYETTLALCERGYRVSAGVTDAVCLFPYLLTGVRAHLGGGDVDGAQDWVDRVATVLTSRAIPGLLPAIDHARGLVALARGDLTEAEQSLERADRSWRERRRFWEGAWARLDLAELALRARRPRVATRLADEGRALAASVSASIGARTLTDAADRLTGSATRARPSEPWHPLTAREFEVAELVAAGMTNRQIAERLVVAPKTVSAHVEHILTKLGAARRTEIAAWCATVRRQPVGP